MLRLLLALTLLGTAGGVLASVVLAEGLPRPALHWSRAENASACIDPHALALRVTALTGPVLVDATEADLSIEGHIERVARGRYEARITAAGRNGVARGTRTLQHSGDCRELDAALAFVVAVLIDPDLVLEKLPSQLVELGAEDEAAAERLRRELQTAPTPAPLIATDAPSPAAPPAVAAAQLERPTGPRTLYQLHFGASLGVRELPRASAGPYLALTTLPLRWLGIDLGLRASFMPGPLELDDGRSLQAQRFAASVLACPRYPWRSVFVELCLGPEVALVRVRGSGFAEDDVVRRAAFVAQIAAGLGAHLRRAWWLRLRGNLQLLLNDPSFNYEKTGGERTLLALSRGAFAADLGVGYQF